MTDLTPADATMVARVIRTADVLPEQRTKLALHAVRIMTEDGADNRCRMGFISEWFRQF